MVREGGRNHKGRCELLMKCRSRSGLRSDQNSQEGERLQLEVAKWRGYTLTGFSASMVRCQTGNSASAISVSKA
ncbi:MAG: hypothetical protein GEEBNDBF_00139 [bacterium]|nr:hypothetical protein [bacterium]